MAQSPPLTRFSGLIRQVDLSDVDAHTKNVFNHFFPEFLRLGSPHHIWQKGVDTVFVGTSVRHGGRGRERRFAGDPSLPRSRYWVVEDTKPNRNRNHLLNELFAYASPWVPVPLEVLDTRLDRRQVKKWLEVMHSTVNRESLLQLIRPHFPGHLPLGLGVDGRTFTLMKYPVLRLKVAVDGVLDLRHPPAQDWVVAFLCQKVASFTETLKGLTRERERYSRWLATLRLLLEQDLGGGAKAAQAIGYELRRLGAAGLVFPSARSDSHVVMWDGQMREHRGFNFVDYRGSKLSAQSAPKSWMWKFPEYPDAVSFRISPNRHAAGSWGVRGLQEINGLRHQTSAMALVQIAADIVRDLCAGKVHPSDHCGAYFMQMRMMFALADHEEEVASIGRFLIPFTPRKPLARYSELEYRSPNWFFTRYGESGTVALECVRCLGETVKKKRERPPGRCPVCALGERATPTEWWPKNVAQYQAARGLAFPEPERIRGSS
jgi:hypothetical protein